MNNLSETIDIILFPNKIISGYSYTILSIDNLLIDKMNFFKDDNNI